MESTEEAKTVEDKKKRQALFAIDWDNVMFPTSYFTQLGLRDLEFEDFVEDFQTDMVLLESDVILLLSQVVENGKVALFTEEKEVMTEDCQRYMPRLWDKLANQWHIDIASPTDEDAGDLSRWRKKRMIDGVSAVRNLVWSRRDVYSESLSMVLFTCSPSVFMTAQNVCSMFGQLHGKYILAVMGTKSPFILKRQLELLDEMFDEVFQVDRDEHIALGNKVEQCVNGDVVYGEKNSVSDEEQDADGEYLNAVPEEDEEESEEELASEQDEGNEQV